MKKYKVLIDKPGLTEEQIKKHKDFDKLFEVYEKKRPAKFIKINNIVKLFAATAAIAAIAILYNVYVDVEKPEIEVVDRFIEPPIPELNVEFASYSFNASTGSEIDYHTGSKLVVPENAFLDKEGNPVEGMIDLQYREMHDAEEFFLSGIPMSFSSDGSKYYLESAGMMEIKASQNGMPLILDPNKKIEVEMASRQKSDEYRLLMLDVERNEWLDKGLLKTELVKHDVNNEADVASDNTIRIAKEIYIPPKPKMPRKADQTKYRFNIDFIEDEFPELLGYKDMLFELENDQGFDPKFYDQLWEDMQLKRKDEDYVIILKKGKEIHAFKAYPVVEESNYKDVLRDYEFKNQKYQAALLEKEKTENLLKEREALAKQPGINKMDTVSEDDFGKMSTRFFAISELGIWNADIIMPLPKGMNMKIHLLDNKGQPIDAEYFYLKDNAKNTVFKFSKDQLDSFSYDPSSENVLWAVLDNKRVAIFEADDFRRLDPEATEIDLVMRIKRLKKGTMEELRDVLNFESTL